MLTEADVQGQKAVFLGAAALVREGRGAPTVRQVHAILRSALGDAVEQGRLSHNPAERIMLPRGERPRVHPYDRDELLALLDAAARERLAPLWELLAFTGLRRGEALGLRWCDADAERALLVVRLQLTDVGGRLIAAPPKTASGDHRVVDLDRHTLGSLLGWRLAQDAEHERWAEAHVDWRERVTLAGELQGRLAAVCSRPAATTGWCSPGRTGRRSARST